MKKMAKEFKDFIAKGNVLDMAIGVIIAGAFGLEGLFWIISTVFLALKKALGFPDGYLIPCFIGIGRPAPDAVLTKQINVDLDDRIHWQKF